MNSQASAAQLATLKSSLSADDHDTLTLAFDDNRLLSLLFGEHDEHIALIEHRMGGGHHAARQPRFHPRHWSGARWRQECSDRNFINGRAADLKSIAAKLKGQSA